MVVIRRAVPNDMEQVLGIAAARRAEYAVYQPQFWRPAPDALDRQRAYFDSLLHDHQTLFAVAADGETVRGFVAARIADAPPVYAPGGPSCVVDDFAVAEPEEWEVLGPVLLAEVRSWASGRGAVQLIVVTAQADEPKRSALRLARLSTASEWWVGPVHRC